MENRGFLSVLADRFSDFVRFRRLGGVGARNQIKQLRPFDSFLHTEGFQGRWPTREVVEGYVATTEHLHPGTRGNRLSAVRQFCRYLRRFEPQCYVPERMPTLERRPPRVPHIFSEDEIKELLTTALDLPPAGSLRPKTYSTLFGLLYTTGMRCGETFALNLAEVDLDQNLLHVREGKFGKSRWVPISPSASLALQRYIEERSRVAPAAPNDPVFITGGGSRLYHTNTELLPMHWRIGGSKKLERDVADLIIREIQTLKIRSMLEASKVDILWSPAGRRLSQSISRGVGSVRPNHLTTTACSLGSANSTRFLCRYGCI